MPADLKNLKPGQTVRCTIAKAPRARAARKTIERLMWRDPAVAKGLRKSHKVRQRSTEIYNRGNRDWVKRQPCARIIEVVRGADFEFVYHHDLAKDVASVADYLTVKAA